ncbi:MAG: four-helix bundle copper-binding protein [Flavobacteriales bacterium]
MMNDRANTALLQRLMECIAACETCADRCLDEQHPGNMAQCIRTDRDCADICTLTARYLARNSPNLPTVMGLCIAICRACEEECLQHEHDHCRDCAKACAACRSACEAHANALV